MFKKIIIAGSFIFILPFFVLAENKTTVYQGHEAAADRIIVKLKEQFNFSNNILVKHHLTSADKITKKTSLKALANIYLVNIASPASLSEVLDSLNSDPQVELAEPDYLASADVTPNDTYFTSLWGMNNTGQTIYGNVGTVDADIDAPEAWNTITDCSAAVVGIIDSGIDYTHPDLAANMWQNPGEIASNGIDDDANGYIDDIYGYDFADGDNDPMDENNHGTHVAGTIGAIGNNSAGVVGVCWRAKLAALRFLDDTGHGWNSDAIEAINYAHIEGFRITNNSWGGDTYDPLLYAAIQAVQNEQVFVAAAGNDNINTDVTPHYPSSYSLANIISVTTTKNDDSQYYNYGATSVDLGAPGRYIYSTLPGGLYGSMSGTSMATPHVTGAAALLLAYKTDLTVAQIKTALVNTGDELASLSGKTVSGRRLNVYNALNSVLPVNHPPVASINDTYAGNEDEAINFDASASTDADGNALTYNWDCGDSTIQTTTTAIISHIYSEPGTYTLSLTVSDGLLTSVADTAIVTVNNVNLAPVAEAGSDQTIYLGETIILNGTASTDSDGTIASYYWDLGDGVIESGATLSYEYLAAGTYTVELEVIDNESAYSSDFLTVTVNELPKVTNIEVPENYITTVSVKIKWKKVKTAVQYRVKLMDQSGKKIKIYKVKKKYIYKVIKNLATSTVYKIKVRAKYDDHIFGPWSKSKKITTLAE